jgi:hypothetical protein
MQWVYKPSKTIRTLMIVILKKNCQTIKQRYINVYNILEKKRRAESEHSKGFRAKIRLFSMKTRTLKHSFDRLPSVPFYKYSKKLVCFRCHYQLGRKQWEKAFTSTQTVLVCIIIQENKWLTYTGVYDIEQKSLDSKTTTLSMVK